MPKKVSKPTVRYRDRQTGRWASLATWKRSKAHGGTRFVRQTLAPYTAKRKHGKRPAVKGRGKEKPGSKRTAPVLKKLGNAEYIVTTVKTRKGKVLPGRQVDLLVVYKDKVTDSEVIGFVIEWTAKKKNAELAWVANLLGAAKSPVVARIKPTSEPWKVVLR